MPLTNYPNIRKFSEYIPKSDKFIKCFIKCEGFNILGLYPYGVAILSFTRCKNQPSLPRPVFSHIETKLFMSGVSDNKMVAICQDTTLSNTDDFCLWFKDAWVVVGYWDQIVILNQ